MSGIIAGQIVNDLVEYTLPYNKEKVNALPFSEKLDIVLVMQTTTNFSNPKIRAMVDDALKTGFAKLPKEGDVITGTVLGKENATLYVDFGVLGSGIVYGREFYQAYDVIRGMQEGDQISAKLVSLENERGFLELSLKEAGYTLAWDDLAQKRDDKEVVEVTIKEVNKGGLIAEINNIFAFMPVSQLSAKNYPRVDGGNKAKIQQELNKFVGTKFKVRIIDANQEENKLIISEKEAQDEDMKKVLDEHFAQGNIIEGEVSGVAHFGIFVKFSSPAKDGESATELEGLVHISELDWQLIENPADLFTVSDKVKAKIIGISGDKISLSIKALKKDPWEDIDGKFAKGDIVKGRVTKINPFGAFVHLTDDIAGLCHISEFGDDEDMRKKVSVDKSYDFYIQSIVKQEHRMALGFGSAPKASSKKQTSKQEAKKVEDVKE